VPGKGAIAIEMRPGSLLTIVKPPRRLTISTHVSCGHQTV